MKAQRDPLDYLEDILAAADKAQRFIAGMDYAQFAADDKTAFAVVRALEIIGEAAKNVPRSVRLRYPSVPWRDMGGIRDRLIHAYFGVNLQVVWKTLEEDLPLLQQNISDIIRDLASGDQTDA
jgi:uncharacterized protein with HEPN domain